MRSVVRGHIVTGDVIGNDILSKENTEINMDDASLYNYILHIVTYGVPYKYILTSTLDQRSAHLQV